jgi:hypothetical protein
MCLPIERPQSKPLAGVTPNFGQALPERVAPSISYPQGVVASKLFLPDRGEYEGKHDKDYER